jgi:hypothetical protein
MSICQIPWCQTINRVGWTPYEVHGIVRWGQVKHGDKLLDRGGPGLARSSVLRELRVSSLDPFHNVQVLSGESLGEAEVDQRVTMINLEPQ